MKLVKTQLESFLNENEAEELMKLCKNFDQYVKKYQEKVNVLLKDCGYEVLLAHSFVTKEEKQKILERKLNGHSN